MLQTCSYVSLFLPRSRRVHLADLSAWPSTTSSSGESLLKTCTLPLLFYSYMEVHFNQPWSLSFRIEEELGDKARFAGQNFRHPIWAGLPPWASVCSLLIYNPHTYSICHTRLPTLLKRRWRETPLTSKVQVCGVGRGQHVPVKSQFSSSSISALVPE